MDGGALVILIILFSGVSAPASASLPKSVGMTVRMKRAGGFASVVSGRHDHT